MNNEYYGAASTPTEDFLAHYGVKGMKWGVRKAVESGNSRRLGRQYNKAAKKLAKLEKRAASGKKYAKRAAALGVGAAAAGGLAAVGTQGVGKALRKGGKYGGIALRGAGDAINRIGHGKYASVGNALRKAGNKANGKLVTAGEAVETWGKGNSVGRALGNAGVSGANLAYKAGARGVGAKALKAKGKLMGISNSGYTRLAGAAVGAGLGAGAAYNAYRAATTKRAAKKAAQFRSEMNKAFAGTAYANGRPASQKKKKRR